MNQGPKVNWIGLLTGFVFGVLLTLLIIYLTMPGMMILEQKSAKTLEETVAAIQEAVLEQGWTVQSVVNMNASLAKHGHPFDRQVRVIKICQPEYAKSILTSDRMLSTMMPCSLAVYETDDGSVMVSQMNSGLMGSMFGGNVATVMGGSVSADVEAILKKSLQ